MTVSRRLLTRLTVASAQGDELEITEKTATVPVLSKVGEETWTTLDAAAIPFSSPGSPRCASVGVLNLEAISSGPLTPGPKPCVRPSYAWRAVVDFGRALMSFWPRS